MTCYAAKQLGRPVRWRAERSEDFLAAHQGRAQSFDAALALDADGRILAMRMQLIAEFGAEPMGQTTFIPIILSPKVATTVYHVPVVDYEIKGVLLNTATIGAYRGAGRPETNYLMERLIEIAAREMGIDPVEIRRRNLIPNDAFPYRTHMNDIYDVGRVRSRARRRGRVQRLARLRDASRGLEGQGQAARPRALDVSRMDRRAAHRDGRHPRRRRRHRHRVLRHPGDGPGPGDELHAAAVRSAGDPGRAHPHRAGRHRRRQRRGQRRLALGVRRRLGDGLGRSQGDRRRQAARRRRARSRGAGHRVPRRPLRRRGHRPRDRPRRARGEAAAAAAALLRHREPVGAELAERRAGDRGGDRSGHRRHHARHASPASTTSAASSTA